MTRAGCREEPAAGAVALQLLGAPSVPMKKPEPKRTALTRKLLELQATFSSQLLRLQELEQERERLASREAVLSDTIKQQEGMVRCLGALLSERIAEELTTSAADSDDDGAAPHGMAQSVLAKDARVHQLMVAVGDLPKDRRELYTNHLLGTSVTPERAADIQSMDLKAQLVPLMRELTMRISFLLSYGEDHCSWDHLRDSLDAKMDEYSALILLLHTAADDKLLALGTLNFDTLEEQQPPEQHWEKVADSLKLTPEQAEEVSVCFDIYQARRVELIAEMAGHVQQLQCLASPLHAQRLRPAAAQARSFAADDCWDDEASVRTASASSAGSASTVAFEGGLGWGQVERLQQLMDRVSSLNNAIRELDRLVVYQSSNVLTKQQLACCVVHSYPFLCQPCAWAEVVFKRSKRFRGPAQRLPPPPGGPGAEPEPRAPCC